MLRFFHSISVELHWSLGPIDFIIHLQARTRVPSSLFSTINETYWRLHRRKLVQPLSTPIIEQTRAPTQHFLWRSIISLFSPWALLQWNFSRVCHGEQKKLNILLINSWKPTRPERMFIFAVCICLFCAT